MAGYLSSADLVRHHLLESGEVQRLSAERCAEALADAAARCTEALRAGGKLLFCGKRRTASIWPLSL